jgi:hypothetical protein
MDIAKLRHVLDQFDDGLDALWTPDTGLPRISAVKAIPGFEQVTRAEIDATGRVRRTQQAEPVAQAQPEPVSRDPDNPLPVAEVQAAPEPVAEVQPAPRDIEAECEAAEQAMMAARDALKAAKDHAVEKRHAFVLALRNWQNASGAPADQSELMRRHAKSSLERRAAQARGEIPPDAEPVSTVGPSRLDQVAAAMAGHKGPGGGGAFRRGHYPSQRQGGYAPRPKVPSES